MREKHVRAIEQTLGFKSTYQRGHPDSVANGLVAKLVRPATSKSDPSTLVQSGFDDHVFRQTHRQDQM